MHFVVLSFLCFGVSYSYGNCTLERSQLEQKYGVRYLAFARDNESLAVDIRNIRFDGNQTNTTFIIHGYSSTLLEESLHLKDKIFQHDLTVDRVIVVSWLDYSTVSDPPPFRVVSFVPINYYDIAIERVRSLANDVSEKMIYIRNNGGKTGSEKMELIGHSLGAHVAGLAGRLFKEKTGTAVDKIVGLDPVGIYFENHPEMGLRSSDALSVLVFHTNTNRYGIKSRLGTKDIFVNKGKNQPTCQTNLMKDICSHNEAWQIFSNFLKTMSMEKKERRLPSRRYVLCLDVSQSMKTNNRLSRSIKAAKDIIYNMEPDSYCGIVAFSGSSSIVHNVTRIEGKPEIKSLISSLPQTVELAGTAIGAGLKLSMKMLLAMPDSHLYCSTIILISDGQQNRGESAQKILPALRKACIGINSVGLGSEADDNLEELSAKTNGVVSYVIEGRRSQQIVDTQRALSYSYESELDADIRPIYLPSKAVVVSKDEKVIPFIFDDNIGKDTKFNFISDQIGIIDIKLTSPNGTVYSSASPEFDFTLMEKYFLIDLAESGQWNLSAKALESNKSVRSTFDGIASVKTHQMEDASQPIRLDATVSNRILRYPEPIIISAELRSEQFPIIHAEVFAHIRGLNQRSITLQMYDDGAFSDELANDGVYTASVLKLPNTERYSVIVTGKSNGTAKLVPKQIDYFARELIDCKHITCKALMEFEREANAGSVKLLSKDNQDLLPPNRVTDLLAIVQNEDLQHIALEWTSPVNDVFGVYVKGYDIRALVNGSDFENAFQFDDSLVVGGSLDATNSTTRKVERILLKIPDQIWELGGENNGRYFFQMDFALKTIGMNNVTSLRSNLAAGIIKNPSFTTSYYPIIIYFAAFLILTCGMMLHFILHLLQK